MLLIRKRTLRTALQVPNWNNNNLNMDIQLYRSRIGTFVPKYSQNKSYFSHKLKIQTKKSEKRPTFRKKYIFIADKRRLLNKYKNSQIFCIKGQNRYFLYHRRNRSRIYKKRIMFKKKLYMWTFISVVLLFYASVFNKTSPEVLGSWDRKTEIQPFKNS